MAVCSVRDWLGHGKWNAITQMVVSGCMMIVCGVGTIYGVSMFPRLLCALIFFFGGFWTISTKDDFRPCWIVLKCVYKPCCGERRDGKCLLCWMWMQIFCFALAALVLTVSAMTLGEFPESDTTEEPPTEEEGMYIPSVAFNATLISLCSIYLILLTCAIIVFFPCVKSWYMEIPTEEDMIEPSVGRLELPPPVRNPQRYSIHRYNPPQGDGQPGDNQEAYDNRQSAYGNRKSAYTPREETYVVGMPAEK